MFQLRSISTCAVRYARRKPLPTIKRFPITLQVKLKGPHYQYEDPTLITFDLFKQISDFLAPSNLLIDPSSHIAIHTKQVKSVDPGIVYDLIVPGWPF
jgi:hypothetical protein